MAQSQTLLSPQCFLYQAMADMMQFDNEKLQDFLKLNQEQSKMLGGMNEDGSVQKKGDVVEGGFYGKVLDTQEEAADKEKEALKDAAKGEMTAGAVGAASFGVGSIASAPSLKLAGQEMFSSSEAQHLSQFQAKFNTDAPAESLTGGAASVDSASSASSATSTADSEEAIIAKKAEEASSNPTKMKEFAEEYRKDPTGNEDVFKELQTKHKAKTNEQLKEAIKLSREDATATHQSANSMVQLLNTGSSAGSNIGKASWDSLQAEAKGEAGKKQAQGSIVQSTVQDMQSTKNNSMQTADKYGASATQSAQKYGDIRV